MPKVSAVDTPDVPKGKLPEHLEVQRTRVVCKPDAPIHVSVSMEFDIIGIDASLANAFRRILIAEVPTMAIDNVLMVNNTSVIPEEVIAHRLGLIPLNADPRLFEYLSEHDTLNERNTIVFKLAASCKKGSPHLIVKSDQLKWLPGGSEQPMESANPSAKPRTYTSFSCSQDSLPEFANKPLGVQDHVFIDKLGPGHAIELEAHAVKGVGKVHAKWSPVSTTWYRMLPEVILLKEIKGDKKAIVANPRACTLCRECIRGVNEPQVELRRAKDHFIFKIESTGALPPEVLFTEAVKILEDKCDRVICELS
ncbi:hypothetical protein J5N97_010254 [Dioscorea zingiberensis]|uniref:DNA-directed RNA polymerase RpoA/D/Rpb3-type domain-containing protein n=1 Tax=Dioscorea zingiberensis TaxID=325984 RepID=A0A9D5CZV6_9LILI|nr:hypothetical protein J5N97_010254 [Dioscorea zingiberensis]